MFRANLFRRIGGISPIQFLILLQLNKEPKYGYEILKTLKEQFNGVWEPKTGTIYPALRRLEERGFVTTEVKENREFYSLTEKGRYLLKDIIKRLESDFEFADKYYRFILKSLPPFIKMKYMIKWMSNRIDEYADLPPLFPHLFLDKIEDEELKMEFLKLIQKIMQNRLGAIEKEIKKLESKKKTRKE